jgi:predicted glycogen debranching enzyme
MKELRRTITFDPSQDFQLMVSREWIVTNGLGGYATGTVAGVLTRRYHGLLVAALPAPAGRIVMLSHLAETVILPGGRRIRLSAPAKDSIEEPFPGAESLKEFQLCWGLPAWRYAIDEIVLEKTLIMPHLQNTTYIIYQLVQGNEPVELELRPSLNFRPHEKPVSEPLHEGYLYQAVDRRHEIIGPSKLPTLRFFLQGESRLFSVDPGKIREVLYKSEESRGYESSGDLWSPGFFQVKVSPGQPAALVASTELWETVEALSPENALETEIERRRCLVTKADPKAAQVPAAELVLAADQFIILPAGRASDSARAHAAGEEARTIIAGYHWFTDWGRDTMISLEGLTLTTRRFNEARYILHTFAQYVRDGLIPNMFPEHENEGLYHTADATLWFFHAIHRYLEATGDRDTLRKLLPTLRQIVEKHLRGTRFGIGVDPNDSLLRQGEPGYQLTWMDAKMDDWVVTPRRGKAVEINALWYNALRLMERWLAEENLPAESTRMAEQASRTRNSFNQRFWCQKGGYLYDVVDGETGDEDALRPNQVFAISLTHPVLEEKLWPSVLEKVEQQLCTPCGLRTLSPHHPDYKANYHGDLKTRDAAYHQGTVWPWLIGPFLDAWVKVHPNDTRRARAYLDGLCEHLNEAGIGSISEICDAEPPFTPRGCIAQAWSVAEVLRRLVNVS